MFLANSSPQRVTVSLSLFTGYFPVFCGELVSAEAGERLDRSSLGHHTWLAAHTLLRLSTPHLGHLCPPHHPRNPHTGFIRTISFTLFLRQKMSLRKNNLVTHSNDLLSPAALRTSVQTGQKGIRGPLTDHLQPRIAPDWEAKGAGLRHHPEFSDRMMVSEEHWLLVSQSGVVKVGDSIVRGKLWWAPI